MKTMLSSCFGLLIVALFSISLNKKHPQDSPLEPIVVLELFTSQGCHSCPPADELLSKYGVSEQQIFPLSFHVDYWDYLGWKDPYSNAAYSKRQRNYTRWINNGVYTPQLIINGNTDAIGSRSKEVERKIQQALLKPAIAQIDFDVNKQESAELRIDYTLTIQKDIDWVLHFALTESNLSTPVKRGENGGKVLKNDHVVRGFVSKTEQLSDVFKMAYPEDMNLAHASMVAYVQDQRTGAILGASKISHGQ
ncbi:MAG: DUF1223 domain-containing protein [Saprospiraceae bacterium]|nr:DUF1223 domain-containing protein [Saprospiraceae bacterium]